MNDKKGVAKYSKRNLFPKESTRRLCRSLGADYVVEDVYDYINDLGERLLCKLLEDAVARSERERKKTIKSRHVQKNGPESPAASETTRLEDYLNK